MSQVLKLEQFCLTDISMTLPAPERKNINRAGNSEFTFNVARNNQNPCLYKLDIIVDVGPPFKKGVPVSPKVHVVASGIFSFPEDMDENKRQWLLRYNGGMILYGVLRGQISIISSAFPTGVLVLPSFDMKEAIMKIESERSAKASASSLDAASKAKPVFSARSGSKARPKAKSTTRRKKPTERKA
jgi:hypothetical protein